MDKSLPLDQVAYKAEQATILYDVILEMASDQCTPVLLNLLKIACDLNCCVFRALRNELKDDNDETC